MKKVLALIAVVLLAFNVSAKTEKVTMTNSLIKKYFMVERVDGTKALNEEKLKGINFTLSEKLKINNVSSSPENGNLVVRGVKIKTNDTITYERNSKELGCYYFTVTPASGEETYTLIVKTKSGSFHIVGVDGADAIIPELIYLQFTIVDTQDEDASVDKNKSNHNLNQQSNGDDQGNDDDEEDEEMVF